MNSNPFAAPLEVLGKRPRCSKLLEAGRTSAVENSKKLHVLWKHIEPKSGRNEPLFHSVN
jgi:hypothetical protein